jgi:hypothetical protein
VEFWYTTLYPPEIAQTVMPEPDDARDGPEDPHAARTNVRAAAATAAI